MRTGRYAKDGCSAPLRRQARGWVGAARERPRTARPSGDPAYQRLIRNLSMKENLVPHGLMESKMKPCLIVLGTFFLTSSAIAEPAQCNATAELKNDHVIFHV